MPDLQSDASDERAHRTRANELVSTVTERSPRGVASMVLGGVLLVWALQSRRKGRALLYALGGAGLVAFGIQRQRLRTETPQKREALDTSDTATSEQHSESHKIDIESRERADEPAPEDPRLDDDNDVADIDLSAAATADEAGEAVGPAPEQAQPVQTEETEPESTPESDSSRADVDQEAGDTEGDGDVASGEK
jgi:hypothetical protein